MSRIILAFILGVVVASTSTAYALTGSRSGDKNVNQVRRALAPFGGLEPVWVVWQGNPVTVYKIRSVHYGSVGPGANPVEGAIITVRKCGASGC